MRLGTGLAIRGPWADVLEQARLVEALGYDSIWVPEIAGRDALVTCGALAAAVERVRLATGIVPMPVRAPATLAMGAAGLAEITGGRFVLGVGLGHGETLRDWFGIRRPMRVSDATEYVRIVRAVLRDGEAHVRGARYAAEFRLRGAHPPQPPPVVLAALGPRTIDLAAGLADGVVLNWVTPSHAQMLSRRLRASAATAGRDPDKLEVACYVPVCVTDDLPAARAELSRQIVAYGTLGAYARVLRAEGIGPVDDGQVPAHVADALGAHGDADAVRVRLEAYVDAGVTLPVLVPYPVGEDPWASLTETWSVLAPA